MKGRSPIILSIIGNFKEDPVASTAVKPSVATTTNLDRSIVYILEAIVSSTMKTSTYTSTGSEQSPHQIIHTYKRFLHTTAQSKLHRSSSHSPSPISTPSPYPTLPFPPYHPSHPHHHHSPHPQQIPPSTGSYPYATTAASPSRP